MKSSITCNQTLWRDSWLGQLVQCILFSVVFAPPPWQCLVLLSVISLLLTNTVSPVRACLFIWLERFCGSQIETRVHGPLSIQSSLGLGCLHAARLFLGVRLSAGHPGGTLCHGHLYTTVEDFLLVTKVCKNIHKTLSSFRDFLYRQLGLF